jgi:lipid-A-disaccharide synthase-like uncharacterized protein
MILPEPEHNEWLSAFIRNYGIFLLGFSAQGIFFLRSLVQWFLSEKKGSVANPVLFWQLSLVGALMMLSYGFLRRDLVIIVGQWLVYAIYVRNLQLQGAWKRFVLPVRVFFVLAPVMLTMWAVQAGFIHSAFSAKIQGIHPYWILAGLVGQGLFVFRFVYQWLVSERQKQSSLPVGFWLFSLVGSLVILSYAFVRKDPVLFLSHMLGMVMYIRNLKLAGFRVRVT